jgi:hypothetical protein
MQVPDQGHGTTFTIRLPLALDDTPDDASRQSDQELLGKKPKERRRTR